MNIRERQLTISEYKFLSSLLTSGISLQEALAILENNHNRTAINCIRNALLEGRTIEDLLFKGFKSESLFTIVNRLYPLNQTIMMCVNYEEELKRQIKDVLGNLMYPCVIIIISFIVMMVGTFVVVPEIYQMFASMNIESTPWLLVATQILVILLGVIMVVILTFIGICIYAYKRKLLFIFYQKVDNSYLRKGLRIIITYVFLNTYILFLKNNLSSKEIQGILMQMEEGSIYKVIGVALDERFEQGMNFELALKDIIYIDERAKQLMKVGYITGTMETYIAIYLDEVGKNLKRFVRMGIYGIQGLSYVCVGLCVLSITNLLFAPLSVLESM